MDLDLFITGAMVLTLLAFTGLVRAGRRALAPEAGEAAGPIPERWPRVALIVPVTGGPPDLEARLSTLLRQDYPDYQVIFATRDLEDPATPLIAGLIREHSRARLVVSGPARSSGQKNANLLAGVKLAGDAPEILAFCDANQVAPPHFLRRLAAPLARGEGPVASGYHHLLPGDRRLATLGHTVSVLILYLTKAVPWLNQPWGGATAIRRDTFFALGVDRLWGETVVDDVSLAARLLGAGLRVSLAPGAALATPASGETRASWQDWLFRQWIYLKYYLPGSWLLAGALVHLFAALTLLAAARLLLIPWGGASPFQVVLSGLFFAWLTVLLLSVRRLHPAPPGPLPWLAAFLAALFMASGVHVLTCLTQRLSWRGLVYDVDWRGRVRSVTTAGAGKTGMAGSR